MKHHQLYLIGTSALIISLSACRSKVEPPAYINIPSVSVSTQSSQGSSSHKIKDAWVIVGGTDIGTAEVPCTLPSSLTGLQHVQVKPGIWVNGQQSVGHQPYVMMKNYETDLNLSEGDVSTITPVFEYNSDVNFVFVEGFDNNGSTFADDRDGDYDTFIASRNNHPAWADGRYGFIEVDTGKTICDVATDNIYSIPSNRPVFLEMDYLNSTILTVGIIGISLSGAQTPVAKLALFPRADWNKVYIDLSSEISNLNASWGYKFYLRAAKRSDAVRDTVLVDNIKLLYR